MNRLRLPARLRRPALGAVVVVAVLSALTLASYWAGASVEDTLVPAPGASAVESATPAASTAASTATPAAPAGAAPDASDEHTGDDDHGPGEPEPNHRAAIVAGPVDPAEAVQVFLARYLNTLGQNPAVWRASWAHLVTDQVREDLADVDPADVPAGVIGSGVKAVPVGDALVEVTVPIVTGVGAPATPVATAKVTVLGTSGRWLVSDLDVDA